MPIEVIMVFVMKIMLTNKKKYFPTSRRTKTRVMSIWPYLYKMMKFTTATINMTFNSSVFIPCG